jgi:hypothetical protein
MLLSMEEFIRNREIRSQCFFRISQQQIAQWKISMPEQRRVRLVGTEVLTISFVLKSS